MEEGQTAKEAGDRQRQIAADFSFKIRLRRGSAQLRQTKAATRARATETVRGRSNDAVSRAGPGISVHHLTSERKEGGGQH